MGRKEDITITLIIPVYNVALYLEQCLDSVVGQSIPFDEVILVNDGSTDNSSEICEYYISVYNYFKFINQENKGLSAARNKGMKYASSRYIMFLDSDDYLHKDTVKILKEKFQNREYDAIFFDSDIHLETDYNLVNRNIYDRSKASLDGKLMNGWDFFVKSYPRNYVVSACMAIYKRDMIIRAEIQFPEGRYYEDNYFTFAFINEAEQVIHISDKLYQRRYRDYSITVSEFSEKKFVDCIEVNRLVWKNICKGRYETFPESRKLLLAFVSDQCIRSLKDYYLCVERRIVLSLEAEKLLRDMLGEYIEWLKVFGLDVKSLDLSELMRIQIVFSFISQLQLIQGINLSCQIQKIVRLQKRLYINVLKGLPFDKKVYRVGIFGTGKHTEGLISLYEKLIGKITCNLVFIDSRRDNEIYGNKKIVNIQRIGELGLDLIVVSSFIYEQEMIQRIREIGSEIPVYTFYEKLNEDIFSNYKFFIENC